VRRNLIQPGARIVARQILKRFDSVEPETLPYLDGLPAREDVLKLFGLVRQLTDVIVIDGRYTYDDVAFDFVTQSQQIVLVAKPTVPSIHNLMMLLTHLAQRECLAQQFVVINQFDSKTETFSPRRLSELLSLPKVFTVAADVGGISLADNLGQTLRTAVPHSHAVADLTRLAKAVLGMPSETATSEWSLGSALNRISHLFQLT